MITKSCRNVLINDLQCKLATHGSKVSKTYAYGKKNAPCLAEQMIITDAYIQALKRYKTFEDELTGIFEIKFTFDNSNQDSITINLEIDGDTYTYTGSGDAETVTSYFASTLNGETVGSSEIIYTTFTGTTLYVPSYDTDFSYTTTITLSDTWGTVDASEEYIINVLDLWNCLTYEEVCTMYEHGVTLIGTDECNC